MLISVTLGNFKSYKKVEIPLAPMAFLIGANASGKSNALEGIRLLSWLAKGSRLDDIGRTIQSGNPVVRGQIRDLFYDGEQSFMLGGKIGHYTLMFPVELEIQIGQFSEQLIIKDEWVNGEQEKLPFYKIDGNPNPHTDEISVLYNNFQKGHHKPHIPCSNRQAIFYQLETPSRFNKKHIKSQKTIPEITKIIRETLRDIVFLDPHPALMRGYTYAKDDDIQENGANLSSVLYRICQSGEEEKKRLLNFIRSLPEQDIIDIDFIITERKDVMVRLVESFGNQERNIDAPLLSDGTLRVLAIGATLLSVPIGTFVIIEEIDNGVHPSRADNLVKQIQTIASERNLQVLLTSHNPALLDALPDESLEDVLCCYRDLQQGDSRIVKLGNLDSFPELIARGTLGKLMTNKILERFLKDNSTAEQRQHKALAWLERFKAEEVVI